MKRVIKKLNNDIIDLKKNKGEGKKTLQAIYEEEDRFFSSNPSYFMDKH